MIGQSPSTRLLVISVLAIALGLVMAEAARLKPSSSRISGSDRAFFRAILTTGTATSIYVNVIYIHTVGIRRSGRLAGCGTRRRH